MEAPRDGAPGRPGPDRWSWLRQVVSALLVALMVAVLSSLAIRLLLGWPDPPTEKAGISDVLGGVRISLTVVAGLGAVVALVVAYRRQRTAEEQHVLSTAADAREAGKLFGERFGAASQQLGAAEAVVRLAGVYALVNLADDWPAGRQMCVDVLCGYLRMPFVIGQDDPDIDPLQPRPADALDEAASTGAASEPRGGDATLARRQEFQVRLAVQRSLAAHLRNPDREHSGRQEMLGYWSDVRLDFFGATLGNFDLEDCDVAWADFRTATFIGGVTFRNLRVRRTGRFDGAVFLGGARFDGAVFAERAGFRSTRFEGLVVFEGGSAGEGYDFRDARVERPELAHEWPVGAAPS